MKTLVKMFIGILLMLGGLYWYYTNFYGSWVALKTVFFGSFGLFLLFIGFLIAWIEYEDWKWEREEHKTRPAPKSRKK